MGMGAVHIGTDGGGSIRIPASFTGIFGLKPTAGRVPIWPPSAFGTLSHLGPMTRSVADAARMLSVLAGRDPRDWQALPPDGADYLQGLEDGVAGLRIAVDAAPAGHTVVPDVTRRIAEATRVFADAGAHVSEAGPDLAGLGEIFLAHWVGGAAHLLAPLDAARRAAMDPGLVATAELGQSLSLADYLAAEQARGAACVRLNLFFEDYDLLVLPTPAADRVCPRPRRARASRRRPLGGLDPVHLPLQHVGPAGGLGTLRLRRRRPAGRPADRRPALRRRVCPARRPRARTGPAHRPAAGGGAAYSLTS